MNPKLSPQNSNIHTRGKTIRNLIKELQTFENQDLEVKISIDGGKTNVSIGLIGKINDTCVLMNSEE